MSTEDKTKSSDSSFSGFAAEIKEFLKEIFNVREDVDKVGTKEQIKANISIKGIQAFVLIASIFIASIGLNANSTAVVIGAMLISPLMGPIIGVGYSYAVNDYETLKRSLMNMGVMVVIAIVTSYIYFSLVPIKTLTEELKGRIEPTVLDVLIAFFGGFAGIIAFSGKNRNINAVAGVAIATALMPPLCTAGYGLAIGTSKIGYKDFIGYEVFLGAFYLFIINSTFISIASFIFVKGLNFPLVRYQDVTKRKRINLYMGLTAAAVLLPSIFIFSNVIKEDRFSGKVKRFLIDEVRYQGTYIDRDDFEIEKLTEIDGSETTIINIAASGKPVPQDLIDTWNVEILQSPYSLSHTKLVLHQGVAGLGGNEVLERLFEESKQTGVQKDSIINVLEKKIAILNADSIPFSSVAKEVRTQYPNLKTFGYSNDFNQTSFSQKGLKKGLIPTVILEWDKKEEEKENKEQKISDFLKVRLKQDTIQILSR